MGCWIEATPGGLLRFRFRITLPGDAKPRKAGETTTLRDTPENRRTLAKDAAIIGAEIRAEKFDYLRWFPDGRYAANFRCGEPVRTPDRPIGAPSKSGVTLGDYFRDWLEMCESSNARASKPRDYLSHARVLLLPHIGDIRLTDLSVRHLEQLRAQLRKRRTPRGNLLKEKSIKNAIDGTLRALLRDARRAGLIPGNPAAELSWDPTISPDPDPFTIEEREWLLEFFHRRRWRLITPEGRATAVLHPPAHAYLYTLFFTGMRPSEASAVRLRSVDLRVGTIQVARSRYLGKEAATKTPQSNRTVRLTAGNVALLQQIIPLRAEPDDYLFTNVRGEPVNQGNFYEVFCNAQRSLKIRLRDFYSCRDTYMSNALTNGVNITWLSEQTGDAESTIRKHYGRFIHSTTADDAELAKIEGAKVEPDSGSFAPRLPHGRKKRA